MTHTPKTGEGQMRRVNTAEVKCFHSLYLFSNLGFPCFGVLCLLDTLKLMHTLQIPIYFILSHRYKGTGVSWNFQDTRDVWDLSFNANCNTSRCPTGFCLSPFVTLFMKTHSDF